MSAAVGDQRLLLVLDNFEHLLDAAAGRRRDDRLVPAADGARHEPRAAARRRRVGDRRSTRCATEEAVELFVQRAGGRRVRLRCERRGRRDLPPARLPAARDRAGGRTREGALAAGAARAARAAAASARRRLARRTRPAAHAARDDRLEPRPARRRREQRLFARLAVFAGGCTLEAAEAVCGADVDAIASLVDKSLLAPHRRPLLDARDDSRVRRRTARRASRTPPRFGIATPPSTSRSASERALSCARGRLATWLERLDAEHANLRAALEHLLEQRGRGRRAAAGGGDLAVLADTRSLDRRAALPRAAAVALGADLEPERLVNSLWGGCDPGAVAGRHRRRRAARVTHPRDLEDRGGTGACLLGGDPPACDRREQTGGSRPGTRVARGVVGDRPPRWRTVVALDRAEQPRQRAHGPRASTSAPSSSSRRAWRSARRAATSTGAHGRYNNLGWATKGLGDLDRARDFYRRGLEAATEIGLVEGQLQALFGLAALEAETGEPRAGARLFGRTKELASRLGAANEEQSDVERANAGEARGALGPELLTSELAAGAALSLEDAIDLALGRSGSAAG